MSTHAPSLVPALALPYIAWRVYRRFHRNVGRQVVHPHRLITGLVFFTLVAATLLLLCVLAPALLVAICSGLTLGGLLALVGLRLTKFEIGENPTHYYTPNTYIGVGLTLLLAGRVLYRIGVLYFSPTAVASSAPALLESPLTMLLISLTAGYYIGYNSGVLIRAKR